MRTRVICWLLTLVIVIPAMAQHPPSLSNKRFKTVSTRSPSVQLDTLSVVPGSLTISGLDSSYYSLEVWSATLTWKKTPSMDSVQLSYRVLPSRIRTEYQRMKFDSVMDNFVVKPFIFQPQGATANNLFDFGNITYNGSFGRGLSFGNRQDVVVNSLLNLQLNGYIADSILISAAITDNNIPIQPDGTTQNLNEFDRVFLQFKKNKWQFDIGDIDLRQSPSYFLSFYKRLQGAAFEQRSNFGKFGQNRALVSGAVAKGKFTRNNFQGVEGNQGPYRLVGANNELFFIVLAGTERVWIDGEMMQRGEDQDYVINYNTAEITFTPKRMITKDKRIQVEFEYADRNFLNSQLYIMDEWQVNERVGLRLGFFTNNDAKNSSINQTLSVEQKQFLSEIGDSTSKAFYPSAVVDTFSQGKILYARMDTLDNTGNRDSIYLYSTNTAETLYSLSFSDVGFGRGNYVLDNQNNANGKVYKWVSPDVNGNLQGQFEPVILLIAPRKQQMLSVGSTFRIGKSTDIKADLGLSKFDVNTFSSKDKSNDRGAAFRVELTDKRILNNSSGINLTTNLSYENIGDQFRPLERLRNVEFNRDWALPYDAQQQKEQLMIAAVELQDKTGHTFQYQLSHYLRSGGYSGWRNRILHQGDVRGFRFNNVFALTQIDQPAQEGYFLRPIIDISKRLPALRNYTVGMQYSLEQTYLKLKGSDSLNPTSFAFETWQAYMRSDDKKPNKWGLTYFTRSDQLPSKDRLVRTDRSRNFNLFTELYRSEKHQFRINVTYRDLEILNDKLTTQKPENTILGRAEYFINEWKGLVVGNVLYELGTGQEQKRSFSYVEVPAGQGEFYWIDYNSDGIQQLNEFEVALYPDQRKFIRLFSPTNEFVKANYLQFNYSFSINPRAYFNANTATGIRKFISRWTAQSSLQIFKKGISEGTIDFNPFGQPLSDSSLLVLNQLLSNTLSYNRYSNKWGMDISNVRNKGKAFLTYGYESRVLNEWNWKTRWNITRQWLLDFTARKGENSLNTPSFANRNYKINIYGLEPRITFTKGTTLRSQLSYKWDNRKNEVGVEKAQINSIILDSKYNVLSNTSVTGRFTFSSITYNSTPNNTVAFIMLDALLPGNNFLWTLDLTKRITTFLELNFQYEGRKSENNNAVHTGRAAIRALF